MNENFRNSVAYAARDRSVIAARWSKSFAFRAARKLMRMSGQEPQQASTIVCYPPVESLEKAADLYNRLHWYFSVKGLNVYLPSRHDEAEVQEAVTHLDHQPSYLDGSDIIRLDDPDKAGARLADADVVLVWNTQALWSIPVARELGRTWIVDPEFYSVTECSSYLNLLRFARTEQHHQQSVERFQMLLDECAGAQEAYVFATGPSLDTVFEMNIPDRAVKVVCNSIVRNDELLSHIQPDVLTFADPVFHFGPSEYAAQFRADAVRAIQAYDCWCVVNTPNDILVRARFPEVADRIIGIPARPALSRFHFPKPSALHVRSTGNIMTLFMLPIASSLADRIHVVGADGREKNESYFWKHSSIAQYDRLMNSAVQTHPSFFRDRLYADYYDEHVELLRELVEFGEARGKQYESLTPSFVPVLHDREASVASADTSSVRAK